MKFVSRAASSTRGFTLLEVMIVCAVVAILAAIAFPSYQLAVQKGRRADATSSLMDLANRMQRYYSENNTFATATIANVGASSTSPQGYYTLSITAQAANTYTIQATRVAPQTADTRCGDLTLTSTNVKSMVNATLTDPTACW
jgi:type IV pilus assembly protein PilE